MSQLATRDHRGVALRSSALLAASITLTCALMAAVASLVSTWPAG